jgi:type IV pilus assembly protein PilB
MTNVYGKEHLGSILLKANLLRQDQLDTALKSSLESGRRLGEELVARGYVTEEEIQRFLSIQLGYPTVKLDRTFIDPETVRRIPEKFTRRYGVLPLYRSESSTGPVVVVAMTDPTNIMVQDEVRNALGEEIFVTLCTHGEMSRHLDRIWGAQPEPAAAADAAPTPRVLPSQDDEVKPSIALILEMLFKQAFDMRATSIHVEPKPKFAAVRYKVDGQYHAVTSLPRDAYQAVLTRIKILAKIPIAESVNDVEEGRFHIRPDLVAPLIDIRVTIIPTVYGEKVVLKVTRRSEIIRPLEDLGFEQEQWPVVSQLLERRTGLVLIAGKNDSGKNTLGYSILSHQGVPSTMVVTVEDPPAYPISGFNQVRRLKVDGDLAQAWDQTLKAVERQEPDIVFLAGVDTREETRMMLRLASTGRRVLATLFADDATSAHWVPFQLGGDSYAVGSVLTGVISCRLLRKVCPQCAKPTVPDGEVLARLQLKPADITGKKYLFGAGCDQCSGTGYSGRTGVFEVMPVPAPVKEMIQARLPSEAMRQAALDAGMMTMRQAGLAKAARGITSLEELADRLG